MVLGLTREAINDESVTARMLAVLGAYTSKEQPGLILAADQPYLFQSSTFPKLKPDISYISTKKLVFNDYGQIVGMPDLAVWIKSGLVVGRT